MKPVIVRLLFVLCVVVALPGVARAQSGVAGRRLADIRPVRVLDAAGMARIAFAESSPGESPEAAEREDVDAFARLGANLYPLAELADGAAPAPLTHRTAPAAAGRTSAFGYTPQPVVSFEGPSQNGFFPADCHLAVGPNHVVLVVNSAIEIYDKLGHFLFHTSLDSLLGRPAGFGANFDPKVRYDWLHDRFVILALVIRAGTGQGRYELGVTTGPDPTAGWFTYEIENTLAGKAIDYPELGFGQRGLYVTGNLMVFSGFPAVADSSMTGSMWLLDRDAMYAGQSVAVYRWDDVRGTQNERITNLKSTNSPLAAPAGLDGFVVGRGDSPNAGKFRALFYGFTLPANFPNGTVSYSLQSAEIASSGAVPDARQKGAPGLMKANNIALAFLGASMSGSQVVTAMAVGASGRLVSRGYAFELGSWPTVTLLNEADVDDSGTGVDHYWPNTARNLFGEQALVYSTSSPNDYPGSQWALRGQDDPDFPLRGTVQAGNSYQGSPLESSSTTHRWGDYAGIDVDPGEQGFWCFDSYSASATSFGTHVVYMRHAEYVDPINGGLTTGTRRRPFRTVPDAVANARSGNDIVVKAGDHTVPVGYTFTKACQIVPDGGTVTLHP